ncbi:hypothetical protein AVEN_246271-1 [Araneus ventricosus]|uniref:RNase H type-1 domain-containing protein n=1 Tax=Araneus ventricosus TaxID=182803 RepID=A0A4Y2Q6A7_ARAVE|nr:hypothetical protein AVEN_246271-1 [Araneus ventricosus]
MPFRYIPSRQRLINLDSNIPNADYEIYTEGSRIVNETGFAVCILKDETNIQNHLFKLNTFNSVFQAELATIEFAANWAVKEKVNIHTDSPSSISAINSANTRSEFVNKVTSNIFETKNVVGLSWGSWVFRGRPMWEFLETKWLTNKPNWSKHPVRNFSFLHPTPTSNAP